MPSEQKRDAPPKAPELDPRPGSGSESTPQLLGMLAHALMSVGFNKLPLAIRQRLISILGLTALFTPLGLWISWNTAMLVGFTILGISCVVVLLLIVWLSPEDEL